jgi:hypothetical protein
MTIFDRLEEVPLRENRGGEIPDYIVPHLLEVAQHPERHRDQEWAVEILLMQVEDYDTYAESGCCKTAFSIEDIYMSLRRLGIQMDFWA